MGWRLYTKRDEAAVAALHAAMVERVGDKFELPTLDERPVLITLVNEVDGLITHAVFLEAQAELCAMGDGSLSKRDWKDAALKLAELCKVYDLKFVRAFVPNLALARANSTKPAAIERLLYYFGFVREDLSRITPFTRKLA
jgi:hypothetical protein